MVAVGLALASPLAAGVGNEARVEFFGDGNAVASCQIAIVVGGIFYLDVEDGLGLARLEGAAPEALASALAPLSAGGGVATCSATIDALRVHAPLGAATRVTGGDPILGGDPSAGARRVGDGPGANSVSFCQTLVILGSVVLGGAAWGMATGQAPIVASYGGDGSSACETEIREIVVLDE